MAKRSLRRTLARRLRSARRHVDGEVFLGLVLLRRGVGDEGGDEPAAARRGEHHSRTNQAPARLYPAAPAFDAPVLDGNGLPAGIELHRDVDRWPLDPGHIGELVSPRDLAARRT